MSDEHLKSNIERFGDHVAVDQFSERMKEKLFRNRFKAHWSQCSQEYLLDRLKEEIVELEQALLHGMDIHGECADVANFAMMISDNLETQNGKVLYGG